MRFSFASTLISKIDFKSDQLAANDLRNRKRAACEYGVMMHKGNAGKVGEKRVNHEV